MKQINYKVKYLDKYDPKKYEIKWYIKKKLILSLLFYINIKRN